MTTCRHDSRFICDECKNEIRERWSHYAVVQSHYVVCPICGKRHNIIHSKTGAYHLVDLERGWREPAESRR